MINPKGSRRFTGGYKQTEKKKKSINPSRQGQSYNLIFSEAVLKEKFSLKEKEIFLSMKGKF